MTGFAGDRVWVPELRGRGRLWEVLWGVALRRQGVRESRRLIVHSGENANREGSGLGLVCTMGEIAS